MLKKCVSNLKLYFKLEIYVNRGVISVLHFQVKSSFFLAKNSVESETHFCREAVNV